MLALFIGQNLYGQSTIGDNYVFTKEQHDQIRKNLDDYRVLIVKFDKINAEFNILIQQYELIKALRSKQEIQITDLQNELKQTKKENIAYGNLLIKHENLKLNYENLQSEVLKLNKQLENTGKSAGYWQHKYTRQLKIDRGDRIMANAVWATITGVVILIIYSDISNNYLYHK